MCLKLFLKDTAILDYRAPFLAAECIALNFTSKKEKAIILDVACGTGLVCGHVGNKDHALFSFLYYFFDIFWFTWCSVNDWLSAAEGNGLSSLCGSGWKRENVGSCKENRHLSGAEAMHAVSGSLACTRWYYNKHFLHKFKRSWQCERLWIFFTFDQIIHTKTFFQNKTFPDYAQESGVTSKVINRNIMWPCHSGNVICYYIKKKNC